MYPTYSGRAFDPLPNADFHGVSENAEGHKANEYGSGWNSTIGDEMTAVGCA